jgi:c-di-GMP-binding flagellar brake protein YcgR
MNMAWSERRRHERVLTSDRVSFRIFPREGCPDIFRRESAGRTTDLAEGGVSIVTDAEIPRGAAMQVRVVILDPPAVFSHSGTVRWSRLSEEDGRWRAGIEFTWTSEFPRREWEKAVRTLRAWDMQRRETVA